MNFSSQMSWSPSLLDELTAWCGELAALPDVALASLEPSRTALFAVDMVNGFACYGALSSPRVGDLIKPVTELASRCVQAGIPVVAFADRHSPDSEELRHYPAHCLADSKESELVTDLENALEGGDAAVIPKNSTNAFLEPAFAVWMAGHSRTDTWIVTGDCTDICVLQFVLTARAWHDTHNRPLRILLPTALVDTFDAPGHPADLMNALSCLQMKAAGIELCRGIV